MKKLQGKTALITGSDSGIGLGIALEFAKEGANIVVCYHSNEEKGKDAAAQIEKEGVKTLLVKVSVEEEGDILTLFEKAIREFGSIDILVNDAGTNGAKKPVIDMSLEEFDRTIKSDLYGAFLTCRSFAQHRRSKGGKGKIINISSVHEEIMFTNAADYNAAKGGLRNLTRTLALELGDLHINVNNIGPGMIVTPMNKDLMNNPAAQKEKGEAVPLKRPGFPDEIGKLAVFLASDDASYITGATYFIDGGLMLKMGREV